MPLFVQLLIIYSGWPVLACGLVGVFRMAERWLLAHQR